MDRTKIAITGLKYAIRTVIQRASRFKVEDAQEMIDFIPAHKVMSSSTPYRTLASYERPIDIPVLDLPPSKKAVATSCIACSKSHVSTIAGALEEAMRFAREGGIMDPEVIKRLSAAEREINIMERIDLSAEAVENSPPEDQQLANYFLPKIRKLRQDIGQVRSVEGLQSTAAEADALNSEFVLKNMQAKPITVDIPPAADTEAELKARIRAMSQDEKMTWFRERVRTMTPQARRELADKALERLEKNNA